MTRGPPSAAPWDRLRAWIDQQEAWEEQHGEAAQLSPRELAAIYDLIPAIAEPDIGNENFLGHLNEQMQTKGLGRLVWDDNSVTRRTVEGFPQAMWQSSCTIKGYGKFPRVGHGFSGGRGQPCFQNKKKARHFAAKQALAAVSGTPASSSHAESSGGRPSPPPSSRASSRGAMSERASPISEAASMKAFSTSSTSKRVKVEDVDECHMLSEENTDSPPSPSSRTEKDRDNEQRIVWLTGRLNLDPPQYKIDLDDSDGSFHGTLRLRPGYKGISFPVVAKMPNKLAAKRKLGEQFLVWLEKEYRGRMDTLDILKNEAFH